MNPLRILSIYLTPDGETNAFHQGTWSVFVRTSGCSVACRWCDTVYSWPHARGRDLQVPELLDKIIEVAEGAKKVTITGGEPLEQDREALVALIDQLIARGFQVTIETAGTEPVAFLANYSPNLALVLDYKMPSAKIRRPMLDENFRGLSLPHVVKFVVQDETDFQYMLTTVRRLRDAYACTARFVLSPMVAERGHSNSYSWAQWVEKMRNNHLPALGVGLNMQLHKVIYGDAHARDEEFHGYDFSKEKSKIVVH